MVARICSYENRSWKHLIDDRLTLLESQDLSRHLETCLGCREKFDSLCASSEEWNQSSRMLREIGEDSDLLSKHIESTSHGLQGRLPKEISSAVISWLAPSQHADSLGELDDYSIREMVGFGGMGTVLKAWDKKLCRMVAIKILHPHLASNGAARNRFAREAQSVACISHPNVVPIHDVAADHQPPYIVMGFVAGGSLQEKIDRDGPLSLEESLRIAMQIAEGLVAAHAQGLVHRDIKPANIMLESRWQRVLITDFGLARALDDASLTASGLLAGTPQYMSPEQARGDNIDHRSDLFSLGSLLYAMLTGHPPFRAESAVAVLRRVSDCQVRPVHAVESHLPAWVQRLLERFLAKDAGDRIASAIDAASLLRSALQHVTNPTAYSLPDAIMARPNGRQWMVSILATSALLSIGFGIGLNIDFGNAMFSGTEDRLNASTSSISAQTSSVIGSTDSPANHPKSDSPIRRRSFGWSESIDIQLNQIETEIESLSEELISVPLPPIKP